MTVLGTINAQERRPPAINYLDDPTIALFFGVRENVAHYLGLRGVESKREFHELLVRRCDEFVGVALVPENERLLDRVILTSKTPPLSLDATAALWDSARARHPRGLELLGLQPPLTRDCIKRGYRQAALRYHPDAGGTHEEMVLVNEAFDLFNKLLDSDESKGAVARTAPGTSVRPRIFLPERILFNAEEARCCHDYRCGLGLLLLDVALDDWRIDEAYEWLSRFRLSPWTPREPREAEAQLVSLAAPAMRLAECLATAKRVPQARDILATAEAAIKIGGAKLGPWFSRRFAETQGAVLGVRKQLFRLNHPRQVEFAYQAGVFGQKEYLRLLKRLEKESARNTPYRHHPDTTSTNRDASVPPFRIYPLDCAYLVSEQKMGADQRAFYDRWKQYWNDGSALDVQGNISYLFCFTNTVLALHPMIAIRHLLRLSEAYAHEGVFASQCKRWLSDCHVLLREYRQALEAYPPTPLGTRNCCRTDCLLSLKLRNGYHLAGCDILTVCSPRITKWGKEHIAEIAAALDAIVIGYEKEHGVNSLDGWKTTSHQYRYFVFGGTMQNRATDLPCFSFSRNVQFVRFIGELTREAENHVRQQMGIPDVREAKRDANGT